MAYMSFQPTKGDDVMIFKSHLFLSPKYFVFDMRKLILKMNLLWHLWLAMTPYARYYQFNLPKECPQYPLVKAGGILYDQIASGFFSPSMEGYRYLLKTNT